jgi:cytochrome c556
MASIISKRFGLIMAVGLGLGAASVAFAHDDPRPKGQLKPLAKAAYDRHDNFRTMGGAFKAINDELKKDSPDVALIQAKAKIVTSSANALPTWFPRGSGKAVRPKSESKDIIWTEAADFAAKASAMQVQASKLNQVAMAGDIAALKAQVRSVGGTCKSCHDKYREEEKK